MMLSACSHTINLRANHFASPVVADNQWGGHMAGAVTGNTTIALVNNFTSNPPIRTTVEVNKNIDATDLLMLNNIGFDASISFLPSLELYVDSSLYGLRWQFLNHGPTTDNIVASIQGAYGTKSKTSSESDSNGAVTAEAKSDVTTTQYGGSIGYRFAKVAPYLSYIRENHKVKTTVTNSGTTFGPYDDSGAHDYFSVGMTTVGQGFELALEYSMININWDRASKAYQNSFGAKIGFAW